MHLQPAPFQKIQEGTKVIEIRLNDEKRKQLTVGDTIVFVHAQDAHLSIDSTIIALHYFPTFKDLYKAFDPIAFGGVGNDDPTEMHKYYPPHEEAQHGVVGIEIRKI
ncbi:MAG: ASCH domain-containing protein [bacterium]